MLDCIKLNSTLRVADDSNFKNIILYETASTKTLTNSTDFSEAATAVSKEFFKAVSTRINWCSKAAENFLKKFLKNVNQRHLDSLQYGC